MYLREGLRIRATLPHNYVVDGCAEWVVIPTGAMGETEAYRCHNGICVGVRIKGMPGPVGNGLFGLGRANKTLPDGWEVIGETEG
jgi:hypothetical protein